MNEFDNSIDPENNFEGSPYGGIDLPISDILQINQYNQRPKPAHPASFRPSNKNSSMQPYQNHNKSGNNNKSSNMKYKGPIFLPSELYTLTDENFKKALNLYNQNASKNYPKSQSRQAHVHDQSTVTIEEVPDNNGEQQNSTEEQHRSISFAEQDLAPSSDIIQDILSGQSVNQEQIPHQNYVQKYAKWNMDFHASYHIFKTKSHHVGTLVDRGANGGLAGADVRVLSRSGRKVTISGIDNHEMVGLDIVSCAAKVQSNKGPIILIMNEYAYSGRGSSIHSSNQVEYFKHLVDDRPVPNGGKQLILLHDGFLLPLVCDNSLMYLQFMDKPTVQDLDKYPHVMFTSPHEWDPSLLNYIHPDTHDWDIPTDLELDERVNDYGEYTNRIILTLNLLLCDDKDIETCVHHINQHVTSLDEPDYNKLRPFFGWSSPKVIEHTLQQTTRFADIPSLKYPMRKHYKSRFPALNVQRRNEAVATDTIFSKTPAVDSGVKQAQLFVGKDTLVSDVYPLKSTSQFVNTLEDMIRERGAMKQLQSDYAQCEISNKVVDILRLYNISNWHSEPYHQHQNPAERRYCTIKAWTNTIMNRSGAPANCWLLCLIHVCYLLNHISSAALDGYTPLYKLTGSKPDISALLLFHFYQQVYYSTHDQNFPDNSEEKAGYWVGVAPNVGDALTFKILDAESQKIVNRSSVRAANPQHPNKRADIAFPHKDGELASFPHKENNASPDFQEKYNDKILKEQFKHVFSRGEEDDHESSYVKPMPEFDPSDLIGRTFLKPADENGVRNRARVAEVVYEDTDDLVKKINLKIEIGQEKAEEVISYNKLLDFIEQDNFANDLSNDGLFQYRDIIGHQGPLEPGDPDYQGSKYNVQVEWETGEITYVPLRLIAADDPVTCAAYAKKKDLLHLPGWKRFRRYAKKEKTLIRAMKQNKIRQARHSVKYMFGYQIPRNWEEALYLDKKNGNSKWFDARKLEFDQLHDYQTFIDHGTAVKDKKGNILNAPEGYTKIKVQLVYAVKHDGRHKV